jgi:hypothetical protein
VAHLFLGLLWALLAFFLVGFGPSLYLWPARHRLGVAIAVAPVVGFVIVTIFGTYLTLMDITVARWTIPLLVAGATLSLSLTLWSLPAQETRATLEERRSGIWAAAGFVVTLVMIVAPQLLGGLQYSILRGNGTDSFNYVAAADYLDREPLSWAKQVDAQTLVNRDDSYTRASALLNTRWSSFMMLAFSSRVAQVLPYAFEYCFSLLCFLLAYGPAFIYGRKIGLRPRYAALTAMAICVGFWAQVILDTRAQSQLNSIPVSLFLVILVSGFEDRLTNGPSWTIYAAAGLTFVSLEFLYPEFLPLLALALLFFLLTRLRSLNLTLPVIRKYALAGIVILVASLPLRTLLVRFVTAQLSYASSGKNNWQLAYYAWLYSNPLAGFWGFGPLESGGTVLTLLSSAVVSILGLALTILLVLALIRALRNGPPPLCLAGCASLAAIIEFAYLGARGQLWAAAKGLSFGYAFFTLTLLGYCLAGSQSLKQFRSRPWRISAAACGLAFLVWQALLGVARPALAAWKHDYPHYIVHHAEYRRHAWDLSAFESTLAGEQGITVWSDVSNEWVSEYLDFALGGQVRFINIGADLDVVQLHAKSQERFRLPQYVIAENAALGSSTPGATAGIVARTADFALLRANSGGPTLISVSNPNGLEKAPGGRTFFWMGNKPTVLTVMSSTDGCALFSGNAMFGPSSTLPYRTIVVGGTSPREFDEVLSHGGLFHWPLHVRAGFNELPVSIKEQATRQLAGDPRPLLLRIDDPSLEGKQCEAGDH